MPMTVMIEKLAHRGTSSELKGERCLWETDRDGARRVHRILVYDDRCTHKPFAPSKDCLLENGILDCICHRVRLPRPAGANVL